MNLNVALLNPTHPIPIPPQLEAAVEYRGDARYFALYWTPAGDEVMVTDGRVSHDGCWWGYLTFIDHPAVMLGLLGQRSDLGSSDTEATHWLVIDREMRTAVIRPCHAAEQMLDEQHSPLPQIELTRAEWDAIVAQALSDASAQMATFDAQAARAAWAKQNTIVAEMKNWLDAQLPANWRDQLMRRLTGSANTGESREECDGPHDAGLAGDSRSQ
jgi:hypothetical protein